MFRGLIFVALWGLTLATYNYGGYSRMSGNRGAAKYGRVQSGSYLVAQQQPLLLLGALGSGAGVSAAGLGALGSGAGVSAAGLSALGSGAGVGLSMARTESAASSGPYHLAVHSTRKVAFRDTPSVLSQDVPLTVEVPVNYNSLNVHMRSRSSNLNVQTSHESTPGSYKETYSQDEPHYNKHTVTRPLVQEVHEIISPYRKIVQEVRPVQEEVQTLIPRSSGSSYASTNYGSSGAATSNYGGGSYGSTGSSSVNSYGSSSYGSGSALGGNMGAATVYTLTPMLAQTSYSAPLVSYPSRSASYSLLMAQDDEDDEY